MGNGISIENENGGYLSNHYSQEQEANDIKNNMAYGSAMVSEGVRTGISSAPYCQTNPVCYGTAAAGGALYGFQDHFANQLSGSNFPNNE